MERPGGRQCHAQSLVSQDPLRSRHAVGKAGTIAAGVAGSQVVANQIDVIPPNSSSDARTLYADLDKGIQSNLDAALIKHRIGGTIRHSTENGVVTLCGTVDFEQSWDQAQQVASAVTNVQQIVNELQIQNQKATSTN
ncbi:MAG: BON domain-containing protein [Bryobacteraceae bacterium]|jgi:hyperosmotically inducible periplasmic protein